MKQKLRSIEIFSGAGGLCVGASRAGFKPLGVIDNDSSVLRHLRENSESGVHPYCDWPLFDVDVRNVRYSDFGSGVDLVAGGPPCQPFSLGGKHKGSDDHRDMFDEAVRAVRELQPRSFVFENVKGLTRSTFSRYFAYILLRLRHPEIVRTTRHVEWTDHLNALENQETSGSDEGLQYNVITRVLNAADYGIPQRRERVFFVGFRSDLHLRWHFPEPTHSRDALIWKKWRGKRPYWDEFSVAANDREENVRELARAARLLDAPTQRPWKTVRHALNDLPDPRNFNVLGAKFQNHLFRDGARTYVGHTGSPLDLPSKTLKAGVHGTAGGENTLRMPDGSVRYLTVREAARLQTFSDDTIFNGNWTQSIRHIGNAVPCDLAELIFKSIRRSILAQDETRHRARH